MVAGRAVAGRPWPGGRAGTTCRRRVRGLLPGDEAL